MNIPTDIWYEVVKNLPLPDLYQATKVCRIWQTISEYELRRRVDAGISQRTGKIRIEIPEFDYTHYHQESCDQYGLQKRLPGRSVWLLERVADNNSSRNDHEVRSFVPQWTTVLLSHPQAISAIKLIFPDVRGNERCKSSFHFGCLYQPILKSNELEIHRWKESSRENYRMFKTKFSPMKLTEITYLASEHLQLDSVDLPETTLKPTLLDSLGLFAHLNIRPKELSYEYLSDLRIRTSVEASDVWIPYCYAIAEMEVSFESSAV